jgi:hypothetical protein
MTTSAPGIIRLSDELSDLDLGDARLNKRACQLIQTLAQQPDRSVPAACGGWDEIKAAYRFFDSNKVTSQSLLAPHHRRTRERMMEHPVVLCIQDSTEVDYTGKNDIEGLGTLNYDTRKGLYLHPTLAVTPDRLPLGILDSWTWTRPFEDAGKESIRWLEGYQRLCEDQQHIWEQAFDTRLVYLGDREADLFDIYAAHRRQANDHPEQTADWLIRAQHDRNTASGKKLWSTLEAAPERGRIEFTMPAAKKRKGRRVQQSLRAMRVSILPPQGHPEKHAIDVTAILARELNPPTGEPPIEWMLLTNLEVRTQEQLEEKLSWYLARWQIEIFFRILKSGCKIEELQLEKIERLEPAIMLYMLIAWRVLYLTMIGRECPELPCSLIFDEEEWQAVYIVSRNEPPPQTPPTINEMVRMIAGLGGFINRKSDGMPGPQTLWIGLQRSQDFARTLISIRKAGMLNSG